MTADHTHTRHSARVAALVVLLCAALTSCGWGKPSNNKDPRQGRVYTSWSDCAVGDCVDDWKVCIGSDLLVHISDAKTREHMIKDDPECSRDGAR